MALFRTALLASTLTVAVLGGTAPAASADTMTPSRTGSFSGNGTGRDPQSATNAGLQVARNSALISGFDYYQCTMTSSNVSRTSPPPYESYSAYVTVFCFAPD
ncbi:hypothetical protein [Amycolatopsis sp. CA-230715]|uniref:hypothetical protein n=1 Tax=Amycolatopsis sp. CA-230715 TaxID=2745196 RepID=UPI001C00C9D0|nr:hypothetical protein [Amycolatopsis sp. CA-230715]QWF77893.1 hypothetical protein HUW46_01286 [Amycolatopsis sp. CA-230715]